MRERNKNGRKRQTHSGEVVGTAWFSTILAGEQHVVQLVPEAVEELKAGPRESARREEETKVRELAKPRKRLTAQQL